MDTLRGKATALGSFTLFDLAAQHLSRYTTIPLQESTFRYLHVELQFRICAGVEADHWPFSPAIVLGATVPPSREAQTLYTTVAETASIATKGRETMATFGSRRGFRWSGCRLCWRRDSRGTSAAR